jgi:hypothetical protein
VNAKRLAGIALFVMLVAACLTGTAGRARAGATTGAAEPPKLTQLGAPAEPTAQSVTLRRQEDGSLTGHLTIGGHSEVAGQLIATYFANGNSTAAVRVNLTPPPSVLRKEEDTEAALSFTLLEAATPEDLAGTVVLRAEGVEEAELPISVVGAAPSLKGVSIQPEKLTIKVVGGNFWEDPSHASTPIQLVGPGVPRLFEEGTEASFDLLLQRSRPGDPRRPQADPG